LRAKSTGTPTSFDSDFSLLIRGLHLKPAAGYLVPLGLKPVSDNVTVRARLVLKANTVRIPPRSPPASRWKTSPAHVDTEEWAALDKLTLDAKKVTLSSAHLGTLLIDGGRISARRTATGASASPASNSCL